MIFVNVKVGDKVALMWNDSGKGIPKFLANERATVVKLNRYGAKVKPDKFDKEYSATFNQIRVLRG